MGSNNSDIWILWPPQAWQAEGRKLSAWSTGAWRQRALWADSCLTRLQEAPGRSWGNKCLTSSFLPPSGFLLWLPFVTPNQKPECRQAIGITTQPSLPDTALGGDAGSRPAESQSGPVPMECVCGISQGLKSKGLVAAQARAMGPQGISPTSQSEADRASTAIEVNESRSTRVRQASGRKGPIPAMTPAASGEAQCEQPAEQKLLASSISETKGV